MTEDFKKWSVYDLKDYLLQHDIITSDIEGSGKNNRVMKNDLIRFAKKILIILLIIPLIIPIYIYLMR